ncbi:hypothetical protein [Nocardia yamanashiensis]|uniref:hypothetical protein n=1 Tax=Nocardia yamanashiensis TaxID=209247 RepID=UPI00082E7DF6|nr:hypothetical protein [Nocardia yamanashiensis]
MTEDVSDASLLSTQAARDLPGGAGIGRHYGHVPDLICPPGASAGLRAFVEFANAAKNMAVDLLGRGAPIPPPRPAAALTPTVFTALGRGETDAAYRETLAVVQAKRAQLLEQDAEVLKVAIVVAEDKDGVLAKITEQVKAQNVSLQAVGSGKLNAGQETALMEQIARTVDDIVAKVHHVALRNQQMAGGGQGVPGGNSPVPGNNPAPGGAGAAGNGGGGGSGDGGASNPLMPLMIMASMLPNLLQQLDLGGDRDEEKKEEEKKKHEKGAEQKASGSVPAPGEPGAPAATPETGTGQPAATTASVPSGQPAAVVPTVPSSQPQSAEKVGAAEKVSA